MVEVGKVNLSNLFTERLIFISSFGICFALIQREGSINKSMEEFNNES